MAGRGGGIYGEDKLKVSSLNHLELQYYLAPFSKAAKWRQNLNLSPVRCVHCRRAAGGRGVEAPAGLGVQRARQDRAGAREHPHPVRQAAPGARPRRQRAGRGAQGPGRQEETEERDRQAAQGDQVSFAPFCLCLSICLSLPLSFFLSLSFFLLSLSLFLALSRYLFVFVVVDPRLCCLSFDKCSTQNWKYVNLIIRLKV